jgi:hypothetical protein
MSPTPAANAASAAPSFTSTNGASRSKASTASRICPPIHTTHPQTTPPEIVERILTLSWQYPGWGCHKLSGYLRLHGIAVSGPTIQGILTKQGLGTKYERLLRLDARLFSPPPPRLPHQNGRPRLVGGRLPTLEHWRDDPATPWQSVQVPFWYGERHRQVELVSQTAVWYHTGMGPVPIRWVLVRDPLGKFPTQALLCTAVETPPEQILSWFIRRWQMEVTFHEVRDHVGVETQRQWSERAIARTTPALLGLFSLVTVLAHESMMTGPVCLPHAAWYTQVTPTFSDALALVRRQLWRQTSFPTSLRDTDSEKVLRALLNHMTDLLCSAA